MSTRLGGIDRQLKMYWMEERKKLQAIARAATEHHQATYAPHRVKMVEDANISFSSVQLSLFSI